MRKIFLGLSLFLSVSVFGQNDFERNYDPLEVRLYKNEVAYHSDQQMILSNKSVWKSFQVNHPKWTSLFSERNGMPTKAFGDPIAVAGSSDGEKATAFISEINQLFCSSSVQLTTGSEMRTEKFTSISFEQTFQEMKVLFSKASVKLSNGKVVQFAFGVHPEIQLENKPVIGEQQARTAAQVGIFATIESVESSEELFILPVPNENSFDYKKVYAVTVSSRDAQKVPQRYLTYVDATSGKILMRKNLISHSDGGPKKSNEEDFVVDVQVNGGLYMTNPYGTITTEGLNNIYVVVSGTTYNTGLTGGGSLAVNAGSNATIKLQGPWSSVNTNGVIPQKNVTLQAGLNTIDMSTAANVKELSAYKSVNRIHDHCKYWMPTFTGMDFQLPTNIDLTTGNCNAFYDGTSINFYALANGCNASSLVADVVFHEYGHGINDNFYQSLGGNFVNGAMGEGYADYWAISCSNSPVLGVGFYVDNQDPIRRYDTERKVYPIDLIGEVHADGEIIMGAWWDTHVLMGSDWAVTMPIFLGAYAGLQAEAADGNEGEAYTNVLLDALLADDDDGDITNGTPHGNAIIQGFYLHGITLISPAVLSHTPANFADPSVSITLSADLQLYFPYTQYLSDVNCHYQVNNAAWQTMAMTDVSGSYEATFDGFAPGTILKYYFTANDVNGSVGTVNPVGAHQTPFPTLPHILLIGVNEVGKEDCDNNEDWGAWQTGVPSDNATTGIWMLEIPIPSVTVDVAPGTIVQTGDQVTPGGEYCFFTGNGTVGGGIGENDVDGGKTTLQTPTIDLSSYQNPIISYFRWYTNSPPGGANPGADYWQVKMSNDNGATWMYVENTKTSDMQWRRNAFHVSDFMTPTAQMKFQFIASDSLRPTVNLSGGSLVEGALDDFIVYEEVVIGVEETQVNVFNASVFPNPASSSANVQFQLSRAESIEILVIDAVGRTVYAIPSHEYGTQLQKISIPCEKWAKGTYQIALRKNRKSIGNIQLIKD